MNDLDWLIFSKVHFKTRFMESPWHDAVSKFVRNLHYNGLTELPNFAHRWRPWTKGMKVKFSCSNCGNSWTSTKGAIDIYVFTWQREFYLKKLSRQGCQNCEHFCDPILYEEEVQRVCHDILNPRDGGNTEQRNSNMQEAHDSQHCERCAEGTCRIQQDQVILREDQDLRRRGQVGPNNIEDRNRLIAIRALHEIEQEREQRRAILALQERDQWRARRNQQNDPLLANLCYYFCFFILIIILGFFLVLILASKRR
jgi:hypothetical protein